MIRRIMVKLREMQQEQDERAMQVITEIKNIVEKVPEGILIRPENSEHEVIGACYMNY